ncbi:MAG: M14 family metallopeptidase [Chloroflexota bacterium]
MLAACQPSTQTDDKNEISVLPTRVVFPTSTATPSPPPPPTATAAPLPTLTVTPSATITDTPGPGVTRAALLTPTAPLSASGQPESTPEPSPTPTFIVIPPLDAPGPAPALAAPAPIDLPPAFIFGRSVEGRDLYARRIGTGSTILMLVGGIHGGYEANTVTLVEELIAYFEATPGAVLPGLSLVLIPVLNPDGLARGPSLTGRFNANAVDLNRNWDCGWEPVAYFRDQQINPGTAPFSEPETQALASLVYDVRPALVLVYHSAANGVFAGDCPTGGVSAEMVRVLGTATGYNFGVPFDDYTVTGTAPSWIDGLGIPAADVELTSAEATEFERNLRGIMALQCWLLGDGARNLEACL